MATISATLAAHAGDAETGGKYAFDGKISREVLENYLARSLHMLGLADSKQFDEDLRMIKNVGAKQIGRVAGIWWSGDVKVDVEAHFARAKTAADRLLKTDPELMLQACIFETVSKGVNEIPIPAWVFEEFGQKPETRNFRYESMGYDDGSQGHGHGCLAPAMSKHETKMWFYYWGRRYIDCRYENIHLGMIGIMDRKDTGHAN